MAKTIPATEQAFFDNVGSLMPRELSDDDETIIKALVVMNKVGTPAVNGVYVQLFLSKVTYMAEAVQNSLNERTFWHGIRDKNYVPVGDDGELDHMEQAAYHAYVDAKITELDGVIPKMATASRNAFIDAKHIMQLFSSKASYNINSVITATYNADASGHSSQKNRSEKIAATSLAALRDSWRTWVFALPQTETGDDGATVALAYVGTQIDVTMGDYTLTGNGMVLQLGNPSEIVGDLHF